MHFRFVDFDIFEAGGAWFFGDPLRGLFDVWLMLAFGADAGNAEELLEFFEVRIALRINVLDEVHAGASYLFEWADFNDIALRAATMPDKWGQHNL